MAYSYVRCFTFFMLFGSCVCDCRRPFYNIAHMVNGIGQIKEYLDEGANSIETDIKFHRDGSVKKAYHGFPCDCFRNCFRSSDLKQFLMHVRNVTDPSTPNNYGDRLIMLYFDLKLDGSANKRISGKDVARHVLDYLWTQDGSRKQEIRVLNAIEKIKNEHFIDGFIEEFRSRGVESRLKDVGFDAGEKSDLEVTQSKFSKLGIPFNVWQGDGTTNCLVLLYPRDNLKSILKKREKQKKIGKVYYWTVDQKGLMKTTLNMDVDGIMTNSPEKLNNVLQEPGYEKRFRLATPKDDPFSHYDGCSKQKRTQISENPCGKKFVVQN